MIDQLTHTAHETWRTLGLTLRTWFTPIIRMWRFSRNDGITGGFHHKMKLFLQIMKWKDLLSFARKEVLGDRAGGDRTHDQGIMSPLL